MDTTKIAIGARVRHAPTGHTGRIQVYNQTYNPVTGKTYYHMLIKNDDGREWIVNNRQVEIAEEGEG